MIIYISESLNSKKNGGSSTSGFEFLQFLRIKYDNIVVVTNDHIKLDDNEKTFYDLPIFDVKKVVVLKRIYPIMPFTLKKVAKKIYYILKDIWKKSKCDFNEFYDNDSQENIIFVNSWSSLFNIKELTSLHNFTKVCIVRGSPESILWQSFDDDKDLAIKNAASYLELFDKLIFVSKNGLIAWNDIFKLKKDSYYLPNSINELEVYKVKQISPENAKMKSGFKETDFNIVVVGSIQKRKAQDILLDIVADLVEVYPNIKFHLVGVISDTWGGDTIYNSIIRSDYQKYFVFYGHSDNQLLFMQAADLLLFTSRAEAFPRTVAEYMAIGKPILAADVSGVNEMIVHGENGLLYNPHNVKELLDGLITLIGNIELQNKISHNASATYYSKFSKKNHIQKALEVFNEIEKDNK